MTDQPADRRCRHCGSRLSRFNDGDLCFPCEHDGVRLRELLGNPGGFEYRVLPDVDRDDRRAARGGRR